MAEKRRSGDALCLSPVRESYDTDSSISRLPSECATWNANPERLSDGHVDEGVGDGEGATMGIQARIKAPKAYAAMR